MFVEPTHLFSHARPTMALAVRGRAIRTFSGQALALALSLALLGTYLIAEEFKNPLASQSAGLFVAAIILATAMTLVIELTQLLRTMRRHSGRGPTRILRPRVIARCPDAGVAISVHRLPYHRAYIDRVRVRA